MAMNQYDEKSKNLAQTDTTVGDALKQRGNELKDLEKINSDDGESKNDYKAGAFLNKVAQVGNVLRVLNEKHCDGVIRGLNKPMNAFTVDWVKAKEQISSYVSAREEFMESSSKVRQFNQNKKVVLSKLQKLEQERNEIGREYEELEDETINQLGRLMERSKWYLVDHVAGFICARRNYYAKCVETLDKLQGEIDSFRQLIQKENEFENTKTQNTNKNWVKTAYTPKVSRYLPGTLGLSKELIESLSNNLQFPFFLYPIKTTDKRRETVVFQVDLYSRCFNLGNEKVSIEDILQIVRVKSKEMVLVWKDERIDRFLFSKRVDREKCLESYWLLKQAVDLPVIGNKVEAQEDIKVLCATYNMADAAPDWENPRIDQWLPRGYDIYAISFQEASYNPRPGFASCEDDLFSWIGNYLGDDYLKLAGTSLMNIRVVIFLKRPHYYKVTNLRYATVATGIAGIIGNKGAAAITFSLYDTSFCFLGSHLAARIDRNRLAARNQNYRDIISRLSFSPFGDSHHEFDHFFWLGDLNYRIELDRDEIIEQANAGNYNYLLQFDQLMHEKNSGNCFFQFEEMQVNFKPTYRFERGSREWSLEKMREPAWCDRILWKSIQKERVKPIVYNACHTLTTSDHSPLYAGFSINVDFPAFPHNRVKCTIKLKNVKGVGFSKTSSSSSSSTDVIDVYLTFQSPWLSKKNCTSQVCSRKAPDPQWNDNELPTLVPMITTVDYLQRQWIRVIATDKVEPIKNNVLGSGIIQLDKSCFTETGMDFKIQLSDRGIAWSKLSGNLQISIDLSSIPSDAGECDSSDSGTRTTPSPLSTVSPRGIKVGMSSSSSESELSTLVESPTSSSSSSFGTGLGDYTRPRKLDLSSRTFISNRSDTTFGNDVLSENAELEEMTLGMDDFQGILPPSPFADSEPSMTRRTPGKTTPKYDAQDSSTMSEPTDSVKIQKTTSTPTVPSINTNTTNTTSSASPTDPASPTGGWKGLGVRKVGSGNKLAQSLPSRSEHSASTPPIPSPGIINRQQTPTKTGFGSAAASNTTPTSGSTTISTGSGFLKSSANITRSNTTTESSVSTPRVLGSRPFPPKS
eukprot:TRINITY_DN11141_c0_g1_i1.p1 TRINITY_DN11141_c0_g1~~TRINITY_DN11141_c0_g1_i1.p1  ORF type:complete len:1159 (-),score=245.47 TRINITY_DN11141_c0_g1_i1:389-3640(-)